MYGRRRKSNGVAIIAIIVIVVLTAAGIFTTIGGTKHASSEYYEEEVIPQVREAAFNQGAAVPNGLPVMETPRLNWPYAVFEYIPGGKYAHFLVFTEDRTKTFYLCEDNGHVLVLREEKGDVSWLEVRVSYVGPKKDPYKTILYHEVGKK